MYYRHTYFMPSDCPVRYERHTVIWSGWILGRPYHCVPASTMGTPVIKNAESRRHTRGTHTHATTNKRTHTHTHTYTHIHTHTRTHKKHTDVHTHNHTRTQTHTHTHTHQNMHQDATTIPSPPQGLEHAHSKRKMVALKQGRTRQRTKAKSLYDIMHPMFFDEGDNSEAILNDAFDKMMHNIEKQRIDVPALVFVEGCLPNTSVDTAVVRDNNSTSPCSTHTNTHTIHPHNRTHTHTTHVHTTIQTRANTHTHTTHTHTHTHTQTHTHYHMHTHTHPHTHTHTHTHTRDTRDTHAHTHTQTHTNKHIHTKNTQTHIRARTHRHTRMHRHPHTHAHANTVKHTHSTHTTHTQLTQKQSHWAKRRWTLILVLFSRRQNDKNMPATARGKKRRK